MTLRPTTALREPANYGLRGWISKRSSDLAQVILKVPPKVLPDGRLRGADRAALPAIRWKCFGDLSRERERHEDVEGPDRPAVAGISGGGHGPCRRRNGFRRIGAARAVGIHAAGIGHAGHGLHHLVP